MFKKHLTLSLLHFSHPQSLSVSVSELPNAELKALTKPVSNPVHKPHKAQQRVSTNLESSFSLTPSLIPSLPATSALANRGMHFPTRPARGRSLWSSIAFHVLSSLFCLMSVCKEIINNNLKMVSVFPNPVSPPLQVPRLHLVAMTTSGYSTY